MAKTKLKRIGSFLCFSKPVTDEELKIVKRDGSIKRAKSTTVIDDSQRKSDRRIASKIFRSSSIKSNSSDGSLKSSRDPSRSSSRRTTESSCNELFGKDSEASIFSDSSLSSSTSSSSHHSHAAHSLSMPEAEIKREKTAVPPTRVKNIRYVCVLLLVLVSLSVMVFCGRLCAILWTATWLYFVPRRNMLVKLPKFDGVVVEMNGRRAYKEEKEKKQQVVMEGFLQRNRKGVN